MRPIMESELSVEVRSSEARVLEIDERIEKVERAIGRMTHAICLFRRDIVAGQNELKILKLERRRLTGW